MSKVEIFELAVGGPFVNQELLRVSAIINALEAEGKKIKRYHFSNEPQAFVLNQHVNDALMNEGTEALPVTIVDGEIKQMGSYPSNANLAVWTGMTREELISMIIKARNGAGGGGGCCGNGNNGGGC